MNHLSKRIATGFASGGLLVATVLAVPASTFAIADSTVKEVAKEMANMNSYIIEYKQEMNVQGMKTSSVMTQYIDIENNKFAMETETSSDIMGTITNEKSLMINDKEYSYKKLCKE